MLTLIKNVFFFHLIFVSRHKKYNFGWKKWHCSDIIDHTQRFECTLNYDISCEEVCLVHVALGSLKTTCFA